MGRRARQKRLKQGRRLRRLAAAVLVSVALLSTSLATGLLLSGLAGGPRGGPRTAVIVDQLSERDPNPGFVAAATGMLEEAGYVVDYYPGQEVTVDFYRELPTHGYDLLVLRVHSARLLQDKDGSPVDEVVLFTSEPFSLIGHREDQEAGRMAKVRYYKDGNPYFGVRADFVTSSMRGGFEGTTIIMMGCSGLRSINETARAFLLKGAESFISWDGRVSGSHSDAATERLLRLMLIEGLSPINAVAQTDVEVGPDPPSGARLHILIPEG